MTASAKGTIEEPGKNVRAKSGLNRSILNNAPGQIKSQLEYKTKLRGGRVAYVDPKYTSQKCSNCGHIDSESRKSQSEYECTQCGHSDNADINGAKNIDSAPEIIKLAKVQIRHKMPSELELKPATSNSPRY